MGAGILTGPSTSCGRTGSLGKFAALFTVRPTNCGTNGSISGRFPKLAPGDVKFHRMGLQGQGMPSRPRTSPLVWCASMTSGAAYAAPRRLAIGVDGGG